mmetsp:Transcript_112592/g.313202  ORF Transcript_112592/g.313202 Transcript_112592/m.313202 type:complete len:238 (+) Transcript_112592:73-786(+)
MAPPNKAREEAWARAFVAEAEAGHSGLTLQLVTAVRRGPTNGTLAAELGLGPLRVQLGQESSAAGRNRLLRRWLAGHREAVVASWTALGFPAPLPAAESAPAPAPQLAPLPAGGSAWSCTEGSSGGGACVGANSGNPAAGFVGVAVFDFDQTITIRRAQQHARAAPGPARGYRARVTELAARGAASDGAGRPPGLRDGRPHLWVRGLRGRGLPGSKLVSCPRQGLRPEDCSEIVAWA